jgi:O-antigen biosynthesis protein
MLRKIVTRLRDSGVIYLVLKVLYVVTSLLENYQNRKKKTKPYANSEFFYQVVNRVTIDLKVEPSSASRLNILLPSFDEAICYGGIKTALELTFKMSNEYSQVRFVSLASKNNIKMVDLIEYVSKPSGKKIETVSLSDEEKFCCHENEIFLCTYFTTVMVWESYSEILAKNGFNINPFYYLIQDFEPGFFPFGYSNSLAQKSYAHNEYTHAIFNSIELSDFFKYNGIKFNQEYVLKPSVNTLMCNYLVENKYKLKVKSKDNIRILLYGRPNHNRNCFQTILAGLYDLFMSMDENDRNKYVITSIGYHHDDIDLCKNVIIRSLGKVSIERYIEELELSHIGISLMASPHPSYPPLEMAIFGLYTITNKFSTKKFENVHPMIHPIEFPLPADLVKELMSAFVYIACKKDLYQTAIIPTSMSALPWEENLDTLSIGILSSNNLSLM